MWSCETDSYRNKSLLRFTVASTGRCWLCCCLVRNDRNVHPCQLSQKNTARLHLTTQPLISKMPALPILGSGWCLMTSGPRKHLICFTMLLVLLTFWAAGRKTISLIKWFRQKSNLLLVISHVLFKLYLVGQSQTLLWCSDCRCHGWSRAPMVSVEGIWVLLAT